MKKLLFIIMLVLITLTSFSQEITKTREIQPMVNMVEQYKDNILISSNISMTCQNNKYTQVIDIISLYYGSKDGFILFISEIESFINTNTDDASGQIKSGNYVSIIGNTVIIYDTEHNGYTSGNKKLMLKGLAKIKQNTIDFK